MTPRDDNGFTLIELLVVIIIIGILSAIAVPTFLKQREKGYRTAAVADMKNVGLAAETYATDHGGSYAGLDGADENSTLLEDEGFHRTQWVALDVTASDSGYCVLGINEKVPGRQFVLRSDSGRITLELLGAPACST